MAERQVSLQRKECENTLIYLFIPVQRRLKRGVQLSPMVSFHHPLSPLVLLVLLPLVILCGRYRPDHVELEHQIPITGQFNGNRLQDGRCYLRKSEKKKNKISKFLANLLHESNRAEEWILLEDKTREKKRKIPLLRSRLSSNQWSHCSLDSRILPRTHFSENAAPLETKLPILTTNVLPCGKARRLRLDSTNSSRDL